MGTTLTVAGTVLEACGEHAWQGDDGACTIAATYRPEAPTESTWRVAMYVHVARVVIGGMGVRLVAEGLGPTRERAERAMTAELARLMGEARGLRAVS